MTVCAVTGCPDAVLRSVASTRSRYRPGGNVVQRNPASVAECLPLRHAAFAVDQQVARHERVASGLVHEARGHVDALRLFRAGVVVQLGHPRDRLRSVERAAAGRGRAEQLFGHRIALRRQNGRCRRLDRRHQQPAHHQGLFREVGNLHIVKDRAGFSTRGVARADTQLIAAGCKRRPRIEPDAERLDALIRLGTNRKIERRARAALRAGVIVQGEERHFERIGDEAVRLRCELERAPSSSTVSATDASLALLLNDAA